MNVVPALVFGVIGLVVGGALQPLIQRTPMRERMRLPAPHCMRCGVKTTKAQAWPWSARLTRQNTCTTCHSQLWTKAPWFEIVCGGVFGGISFYIGFAWALPAFLLFAFSSIALCVIDYRHHLLPNRIIYPTLFASLILLTIAAAANSDWNFLLRGVIGMFAAWLFFFVVWFIKPQAMGFGDVRLALLVGLFTGCISLSNTFLGVFLGLLLGAVAGLAFVALRKVGVKDPIPYGPFLIAGAFISIFFGESLGPVISG